MGIGYPICKVPDYVDDSYVKQLCTKIIDGPAKNTIINIICIENGQGSEIKFDINLKLSLKAKFLSPLIKKLYKRYLTAIIYKIISRETNKID